MKLVGLAVLLVFVLLVSGCVQGPAGDYCVKKGTTSGLNLADAMEIAGDSECSEQGTLRETYFCNEDTGTWWIGFEPEAPREYCNPACVVNVETKEAEINWRCMGLLPQEGILERTCMAMTGESMTISEALDIGEASGCAQEGVLTFRYICNSETGTLWIDLEPYAEKPGCSPACVVNLVTRQASVNWRCTGAF